MPQLAPYLFERLHDLGIGHSFGIPGDFALTLYDALAASAIEPVVMAHEPGAGFAADAYARIRGAGVAVVTYSVGGLNMVNAVAGAYAEKSPLVVVSGGPGVRERQERDLLHHKIKSFDTQRRIYEEVTVYAATLDDPITAATHIQRALDRVQTYKRPVYLEIPRDMVFADIEESSGPAHTKQTDPATLEEALSEARAMLHKARCPVLLADVEVHRFGLQNTVLHLAEQLGVPVCSTMLGKSAFPEGHPQYAGVYNGEAGDPLVRDLVESADCLLMLGVFLTDINMGMFTAHLDPARTIYATSERLSIKHHEYRDVRFADFVDALADLQDWPRYENPRFSPMRPRVAPDAPGAPVSMRGLLYELNNFIDGNTMLITDVGDPLFAADDIVTREGTSFLCPAYYASMGFAIPGLIGAQLADPFRRAVCLVGDGAFQMTGMELMTVRRLDLHPLIILLNNGSYASLRAMGHENADFVNLGQFDYARLAETMGARGVVIETGDDLRRALDAAKQHAQFTLLDVRLAPDDVSPALARLGDLFAKTLRG